MRGLRLINVSLREVLTSIGFYACVLLTALLCFTAKAYYDIDENKSYSVIGAYMELSREEMLTRYKLSSYEIISCIFGGWLPMFIPIIAAFPFMPLICDERESKFMRYSVFRSTRLSFRTGNFLTAMITGGFAVMTGFSIFAGAAFIMFPDIGEYAPELREPAEWQLSQTYPLFAKLGYPYLIALDFIEMFLYGAVSSLPALIVTAFIKNKYLVLCIPFFLKYITSQLHKGLLIEAYSDIENIDQWLLDILSVTEPDAIGKIFSYGENIWKSALIYAVLLIIGFALYCTAMNRRVDFGE